MKVKLFRFIAITVTVLWMLLIFSFSAQNATKSASLSKGLKYKLFSLVYPDFDEMTEDEQQELLDKFPIRKLAHFFAYSVLGILSWLSFVSYKKITYKLRCVYPFFICVIYAVSDELHQYFVAGRSCELRDVVIDSSGALLAIIIISLYSGFSKRIYQRIKSEEC
ncbi:MAG: VanZ family protein [Clostridia bacterium]|nr:VanZ family protein [Clostridia bacterium]